MKKLSDLAHEKLVHMILNFGSILMDVIVSLTLEMVIFVCTKLSYKGHLISKCLFGVFNFLQKTNEN
jgi:hypothetical protein